MSRSTPLALALVGFSLLVGAPGCAAGNEESPDGERREAVVELAIAELDGPPEYTFARVSGLAADDRGRVYVADADAHDVRVFDADGRFVRQASRFRDRVAERPEPGRYHLYVSHACPWAARAIEIQRDA